MECNFVGRLGEPRPASWHWILLATNAPSCRHKNQCDVTLQAKVTRCSRHSTRIMFLTCIHPCHLLSKTTLITKDSKCEWSRQGEDFYKNSNTYDIPSLHLPIHIARSISFLFSSSLFFQSHLPKDNGWFSPVWISSRGSFFWSL